MLTWSTPIGMGMGVRSTLYHVRICDFAEYLNLSEIFFWGGVTIRKSLLMETSCAKKCVPTDPKLRWVK